MAISHFSCHDLPQTTLLIDLCIRAWPQLLGLLLNCQKNVVRKLLPIFFQQYLLRIYVDGKSESGTSVLEKVMLQNIPA